MEQGFKPKLSPPWQTYVSEVKALFGQDDEIHILYDDEEKTLKLFVDNDVKADALSRLLPAEKTFGNVKITIEVVPANKDEVPSRIADIKNAFNGNGAVDFIYDAETPFGDMHYVVFEPEVVQFYNDDMSDINGNRSTLYQEIAREILGNADGNVYFCTAPVEEKLAKPLGEWP